MKVITIGRSSECSIVINDVKVSRVHAQLVQNDNGNISVVDLGSTNGTRINGKRINGEMRLNPGDELRVGDTVLPWQNYIATVPSQVSQPVSSNTQSSVTVTSEEFVGMSAGQPGKNKNTLLWIILAVVLGLLITGGVLWLLLSRGAETSGTNDTIRITDTIRNKDYENYLLSLLDEKDSVINSRNQATSGKNNSTNKKDSTDSNGANAKQGVKDCTDAKPGVSTKSPNDKPVPITQLPPQNPDEDLIKQFNKLVDDADMNKTGRIYAEVIGGINGTRLSPADKKKAIKEKYKTLPSDKKKSVLSLVKSIVNK